MVLQVCEGRAELIPVVLIINAVDSSTVVHDIGVSNYPLHALSALKTSF